MTPEDTSQEKLLLHQEHAYFSVLLSAYNELHTFQEVWHQEDPEEHKG